MFSIHRFLALAKRKYYFYRKMYLLALIIASIIVAILSIKNGGSLVLGQFECIHFYVATMAVFFVLWNIAAKKMLPCKYAYPQQIWKNMCWN